MRSFSSRSSDKCNLKSSDRFIQTRVTSYLNATISSAFETIEFEIFKSTHARENLSRQFSILIHFSISRFSMISQSSSICRRRQEHFVTHLSSNWFTSIASRVEEISVLREYWSEEVTKVICFRIQKFQNVLFCFYFFRSLHDHSFERTSDCYSWESLACFIVLFILHSIIIYLILLWESHWSEETKSCLLLFYWFVKTWLFFFVCFVLI